MLVSCTSCELKWRDHRLDRATTIRNVGGTIRVLETWDTSYAEERARMLGTLLGFENLIVVAILSCWTQSSMAERSSKGFGSGKPTTCTYVVHSRYTLHPESKNAM